jgi:hypothetical protein
MPVQSVGATKLYGRRSPGVGSVAPSRIGESVESISTSNLWIFFYPNGGLIDSSLDI